MVILKPIATQNASILTRPATGANVFLRVVEDGTNVVSVIWPTSAINAEPYFDLTFDFTPKSGRFYFAHLYETTETGQPANPNPNDIVGELWRGKMFCTEQSDLQIFTMYPNQYLFKSNRENQYKFT